MLNEQRHGGWARAGRTGGVLTLGLLALADTAFSVFGGDLTPVTWAPRTALALAAALLWLTAHRYSGRRLAWLALALAGSSLLATVLLHTLRPSVMWGLAETLALLLVLAVTARRGEGRCRPGSLGALCLALCAQPWRSPSDHPVLLVFLHGLTAGVVLAHGLNRRFRAAEHRRRLAAVRAEQRAEFARDLHDFVAHHVSGIVVQAQGARYVADHDPGQAVEALRQIEQAGTRTLTAMRRMVGVLRDTDGHLPLMPLTDLSRLTPLIEEFTAAGGPEVRTSAEDVPDDLPVEVAATVHRVVMEALTNVRKHASAASLVRVELRGAPGRLLVRVTDDGASRSRRAEGTARPGFGLAGLAERVGTIGGRLHAGPGGDGSWTVEAVLPLPGDGTGA